MEAGKDRKFIQSVDTHSEQTMYWELGYSVFVFLGARPSGETQTIRRSSLIRAQEVPSAVDPIQDS